MWVFKSKVWIGIWCLLISNVLSGQSKQITNQSLYWIRYYNQAEFNPNWVWHNELEERRFLNNNQHHHFIFHSRMHYKFNSKFDIAGGITYSLQSPHFQDSNSNLSVPEWRPVQEVNWIQTITPKWKFSHRFRTDERFIHKNEGNKLISGYDFNFRFRYRLQASATLLKNYDQVTVLKIANEIMWNAGKAVKNNHFDQNRFYIGIEQKLSDEISAEFGYLYWYQQRPSGYQFFDRDILRLTFFHRIKI